MAGTANRVLIITLVKREQRAASVALGRVAGNFGLGSGATVAGFIVPAEARRVWADCLARAGTVPEVVRNTWLGTPAHIAARFRPYRALGFDTMIAELPAPYDLETIERLATEVAPLIETFPITG